MSMNSNLMISSATAGLVALSAMSGNVVAQDKKTDKEKYYNVAKKALNDCGTAKHSCAANPRLTIRLTSGNLLPRVPATL